MKKLLSILSAGALLLTAAPVLASAEEQTPTITAEQFAQCDFNDDGNIDLIDVQWHLKMYAYRMTDKYDKLSEELTLIKENVEANGDLSLDGVVDARDSALMLEYIGRVVAPGENFAVRSVKDGDFNGDSIIDARDASIALSCYAMTSTGQPIYNGEITSAYFNGDLNNDGTVDSRDASEILDIYAKNSTTQS